jgi:hypothetical protein
MILIRETAPRYLPITLLQTENDYHLQDANSALIFLTQGNLSI